MGKRLSANAPKPRSHFPFPGYPTVAAASLYLCLSGGCSRVPGPKDPANAAVAKAATTSTPDTTSTGGHLAGTVPSPYDNYPSPPQDHPTATPDADVPSPTPDAGVPDVLPPAPDTDVADTMPPHGGADLAPVMVDPTGGGGAPAPY